MSTFSQSSFDYSSRKVKGSAISKSNYRINEAVRAREVRLINAEGKNVELVADVGGWPELGTYKPAQDDAIQKGFDGLGCSFGAATWYQALLNADMSDTVKIAAIDAFSDLTDNAWNSDQMACTPIETTSMFGAGIPMLLNALAGHDDLARDNGQAARLDISWWLIKLSKRRPISVIFWIGTIFTR